MKSPSLGDRFRYHFDNFMAKGSVALIGGLGLLSALIVGSAALLIVVLGIHQHESETEDFTEAAWNSLMRTLDAGTMGGDTGTGYRLVMLAVTFGGIFVVSALIGILNNALESKLEELRKGRSWVIEKDHTVVLGWSEQVFSVVSELILANESQHRPRIVILGEKDKVEMEDALSDRIPDWKNTKIICRTGSPIDPGDLSMVSVQTSRSIIVVPPEEDDEPDAAVIKTILAITNSPDRRQQSYHIVAQIRDPRNMEAARMVGKHEVELVQVGDLISRITVQTCRQSGLSVVYTELLDFGGDEIYFKHEPQLTGKTYAEAQFAFESSAVMGLRIEGKGALINPPASTVIGTNDQIIVIAEDDSMIKLSGLSGYEIDESAICPPKVVSPEPERTLILGWNWRVGSLINEMDQYVAPGSEVMVAADKEDGEAELARQCDKLENLRLRYRVGDTTERRTLEELALPDYQHIILLCSDELDPQRADARALIALLHVRDIVDRSGIDVTIVSEMLDIRNRNLAEVTRADDFIVSDKLVSLMLSQISENKELNGVFQDLFSEEGSEIYLKPATNYIHAGRSVNFYTVLQAANARGETAIGYRIVAKKNDPEAGYGVVVNPDKSEMITFTAEDKVIVLAEA